MQQNIAIKFYNRGLRSYIEVDLCRQCPRQDGKGCCGHYSPVFYPTDFVYILQHHPGLIDEIFALPHITILDSSVTLNQIIDADGYRCPFHTQQSGCLLPQDARETICRHFVCPGIDWQSEASLAHWKNFFDLLFQYEIDLNDSLAVTLKQKGLSLRDPAQRPAYFQELRELFPQRTWPAPSFFNNCPASETAVLTRNILYGKDWPL